MAVAATTAAGVNNGDGEGRKGGKEGRNWGGTGSQNYKRKCRFLGKGDGCNDGSACLFRHDLGGAGGGKSV